MSDDRATFERLTDAEAASPTLIEGLPGHGLVAAIAVDLVTRQLDLKHHGNVTSPAFPPAITFDDGLVRDLVRVYAGEDPDVMTLQSDLALPPNTFESLSDCVLNELAEEFERAIFLAGAPARSEERVGEVVGVATTEAGLSELEAAGVPVAEDTGLVGGVTGALAKACYHGDVPALVLVVRAHPFLPDPAAARSVIETALEPLVDFDIDTTELAEQADEIQRQMRQIAEQYQQMAGEQQPQQQPTPSMYQ
jgi:uncharacterized protein